MAFNIAPDESKFSAHILGPLPLGQPRARRNKYRKLLRPPPTTSRLRTELTDRAGLTKPKHRHEYFPNLLEPKGFSHGPPHRGDKGSRGDGRLNVMSASTNLDSNLAAFREDRGELKRDVASLIEHFRADATNRVQNAAGRIDRGVRGTALSPTRGEKSPPFIAAPR
jgi:hypothetical protein